MSLTAALLLGGHSTRMGRDKALVEIGGQPLWWVQWQKLRALRPARLLMSARPGQPVPTPPPPVTVVRDATGEIGPVGGLLACLEAIQLDGPGALLLVLGIDLPCLPVAFLEDLVFASDSGCGTVVRHADRYEPLAAVYPATMRDVARRRVRLGQHALQGLVQDGVERGLMMEMGVREWPPEMFLNLNTPEDLAKVTR